MKALRPLWVAFRTAVLATAVYGVALFIIERSGWKGLAFSWLDTTEYVVFFVIFFVGSLFASSALARLLHLLYPPAPPSEAFRVLVEHIERHLRSDSPFVDVRET